MTAPSTPVLDRAAAIHTFSSVLVGVDGSPEATEAARQAAVLVGRHGTVTLVSAWAVPPPLVLPLGSVAEQDEAEFGAQARELLRAAQAVDPALAGCATEAVPGVAWQTLLERIERDHHTLVVLGAHERSRRVGIILGSTTTELVHKAPCSVLVARRGSDRVPRRIVVGVDGSPQSAAAFTTARELATRFDAELRPVVAHGDGGVDRAAAERIVGHRYEALPDPPVTALRAAAAEADLLVVGSRGVHGLAALGSVSEHVAHEASCSTLVVRQTRW